MKLNSSTYELILTDYMNRMPIQFAQLLKEWCKLGVVDISENFLQTLLNRIEQYSSLSGKTYDVNFSLFDSVSMMLLNAFKILIPYYLLSTSHHLLLNFENTTISTNPHTDNNHGLTGD